MSSEHLASTTRWASADANGCFCSQRKLRSFYFLCRRKFLHCRRCLFCHYEAGLKLASYQTSMNRIFCLFGMRFRTLLAPMDVQWQISAKYDTQDVRENTWFFLETEVAKKKIRFQGVGYSLLSNIPINGIVQHLKKWGFSCRILHDPCLNTSGFVSILSK